MLCIVCWQWNIGYRSYLPEYVNALARGYKRNLSIPHRFVCITDETSGFSSDVEVIPLPTEAREAAGLASPEGPRFPASYRRLWTFSEQAKALGDWILMTDIDAVITGPVDPLIQYALDKRHDFVGWRPRSLWGVEDRIAGGNWLLRAGTRTHVWDSFSRQSAIKARQAGYRGSDQAYISYCLAKTAAVWPQHCGIYQAQDMKKQGFKVLPKDARIVHFNGATKGWTLGHIPWIRSHTS
jgi:hypothetical protein